MSSDLLDSQVTLLPHMFVSHLAVACFFFFFPCWSSTITPRPISHSLHVPTPCIPRIHSIPRRLGNEVFRRRIRRQCAIPKRSDNALRFATALEPMIPSNNWTTSSTLLAGMRFSCIPASKRECRSTRQVTWLLLECVSPSRAAKQLIFQLAQLIIRCS